MVENSYLSCKHHYTFLGSLFVQIDFLEQLLVGLRHCKACLKYLFCFIEWSSIVETKLFLASNELTSSSRISALVFSGFKHLDLFQMILYVREQIIEI